MDLATQQILSSLSGGDQPRAPEDGLANFGNKVKEYWNTVKTEPPGQVSRGREREGERERGRERGRGRERQRERERASSFCTSQSPLPPSLDTGRQMG